MYNLKEILVGYINEYQKIKKEIEKVESNIKILDNSLRKCIPLLSNNQELTLYFIDGKRNILDTMVKIKEHSNVLVYELENLEWDKTINILYHLENTEREYHILIQYIKEFENKVMKILNSKYSKYIKGQFQSTNGELLKIDYNILTVDKDNQEFVYYPYPDIYKINSLEKTDTFLVSQFSKEQFNIYQQEFIELNKNQELILKK